MTLADQTRALIQACRAQGSKIETAAPLTEAQVEDLTHRKSHLKQTAKRAEARTGASATNRPTGKAATLLIVAPTDPTTARYYRERDQNHTKYAARKARGICARCPDKVAVKRDGKPAVLCETCLEANRVVCRRVRAGETGVTWKECLEGAKAKARGKRGKTQ